MLKSNQLYKLKVGFCNFSEHTGEKNVPASLQIPEFMFQVVRPEKIINNVFIIIYKLSTL